MKNLLINIIIVNIVHGQRYIIDNDSDLPGYVAFPIDICFRNTFGLYESYLKYTCSGDGLTVTKTEYSDSSCNTQVATDIFTNTNDSSPCGGDILSCIGSRDTDAYVDTALSINSDCSTLLGSIPNVVGCYCDTDSSSYSVDCTDAATGTYSTYTDSTTCDTTGISQDLSECYQAKSGSSDALDPDVFAQIDDCKLSSDTLDPTMTPTQTSDSPSSAPTLSTTSTPSMTPTQSNRVYNSRYIIDNDWVLSAAYPFPFDVCLQTQPELTGIAYVKYVCSEDGNSVTKYKWTEDEISGPLSEYNCSNTTAAITESIDNSVTNSCKRYYFKCDGEDNYAMATLSAGIQSSKEPDCDQRSDIFDPLLVTAVATEVCFCGSEISGKVTCDENTARTFNYSDTNCMNEQAEPSILGQAAKCTYFISVNQPYALNIFGVLDGCIDNGANIYQTLGPTSEPSAAPSDTTKIPTATPSSSPTSHPSFEPSDITQSPSSSPTTEESDDTYLHSFNLCLLFTIFLIV